MPLNEPYASQALSATAQLYGQGSQGSGSGFGYLPILPADMQQLMAMDPTARAKFLADNAQRDRNGQPLMPLAEWIKQYSNAGAGGAPSTPPPAPAPPAPFSTPEQQAVYNDNWKALNDGLAEIENELRGLTTDITFEIGEFDASGKQVKEGEIDRNAKKASSGAQDEAVGRGIFHSSIKDAELFDIEATRNLRRTFLQGKLSEAQSKATRLKTNLEGWWNDYLTGTYQPQQVQNAQGVSSGA
jgi:hypothetical protein